MLSKAAAALTSAPIAPRNADTFHKLQQLHPRRDSPASSPQVPPSNLSISTEALAKSFRTAARGGAADLLGLRYEHLQALLPQDGSDNLACVSSIVLDIARARVPRPIVEILRITHLFGTLKDDNSGVRPLAVGNTTRRVITRAIAFDYKDKWCEAVGPHQYAIGTESGLDKLYRGVQSYTEANPTDHSILQLDGRNAFNACNRQIFLDSLASKFPELTPFFALWYDGEAPLWFRFEDGSIGVIPSSDGSQQGDPAGGFLFSLGFAIPLENIVQRVPHALVAAATDDLHIGVPTQDIPLVWEVASEECAKYNIELVARKSKIYTPHFTSTDPQSIAPSSATCTSDGIRVLGSPLGSEEYMSSFISSLLQDHQPLLSVLPLLGDNQVALLLLRYCCLPRIHHLLRTVSPYSIAISALTAIHDSNIMKCFSDITGLTASPSIVRQIRLPIRLGGLGLTSTSAVAEAAYIGSVASCLSDVISRHGNTPYIPNPSSIPNMSWVLTARNAWASIQVSTRSTPSSTLSSPWSPSSFTSTPTNHLQKTISDIIHLNEYNALCANANTRDLIRLRSVSGKGAGAFLSALPSERGCSFSNAEIDLALRLRLGSPLPAPPPLNVRASTPLIHLGIITWRVGWAVISKLGMIGLSTLFQQSSHPVAHQHSLKSL